MKSKCKAKRMIEALCGKHHSKPQSDSSKRATMRQQVWARVALRRVTRVQRQADWRAVASLFRHHHWELHPRLRPHQTSNSTRRTSWFSWRSSRNESMTLWSKTRSQTPRSTSPSTTSSSPRSHRVPPPTHRTPLPPPLHHSQMQATQGKMPT